MTEKGQAVQEFLEVFFGEGNQVPSEVLDSSSSDPATVELQPFLRLARVDWERLILPRITTEGLSWYALAKNSRAARVLQEELLAFVGPSYTDFRGQRATLDPLDRIEAAILELAGSNVFRLRLINPGLRTPCRIALRRLIELSANKPLGMLKVSRPSGRVLRDFEFAVLAGARDEASEYLKELRSLGATSARNLRFLEVYLHEAFNEWDILNDFLEDGALVQARRPTRVTRALIRAVYLKELSLFEEKNDPEGALDYFKRFVRPRFSSLYTSLASLEGSEVTKSFLLAAASADPPSIKRRDMLMGNYPPSAMDRAYVEALANLIPLVETKESNSSDLEGARTAFISGDLDTAFGLLLGISQSAVALELLIRCAREMTSIEAAALTIDAVQKAPTRTREDTLQEPRVSQALEELERRYAAREAGAPETHEIKPIPANWIEWLARLQEEPDWPGALSVAEQGALEWSIGEFSDNPSNAQRLVELLQSEFSDVATAKLVDAMPFFLDFFVKRGGPSQLLKPVQMALLDALLYAEASSLEVIRATGPLLEVLMRGGIGVSDCQRIVCDIQEAWLDQRAFALIDWALDILDILVTLQVAPKQVQESFAGVLCEELLRWSDRISLDQLAFYEQLCREGGFIVDMPKTPWLREESALSKKVDPMVERLSGNIVALYSLRTEVIKRARDVLSAIVPDIDIRLFSEKGGSAPLQNAARNADFFVIVTGAAKHAATDFIRTHRPVDATTLWCHTNGTAALLRTLREACSG